MTRNTPTTTIKKNQTNQEITKTRRKTKQNQQKKKTKKLKTPLYILSLQLTYIITLKHTSQNLHTHKQILYKQTPQILKPAFTHLHQHKQTNQHTNPHKPKQKQQITIPPHKQQLPKLQLTNQHLQNQTYKPLYKHKQIYLLLQNMLLIMKPLLTVIYFPTFFLTPKTTPYLTFLTTLHPA